MTVLPGAAQRVAPEESVVLFTVLEPERKPWHYRMTEPEEMVGRGGRADLQIDNVAISRMHARLERTSAGTLRVTDLGSTNGTYINGVPVEVAVLCEGELEAHPLAACTGAPIVRPCPLSQARSP